MSKENINSKGLKIPKRFIIVILASLATAIQYTIRCNLSVTIVAMVEINKNNTELDNHSMNKLDFLFNQTDVDDSIEKRSKFIGCPIPNQNLSSNKIVKHNYKGPKLPYTEATQGFLLGSFFYGYILTHVVAGQISSIFGAKKTIGVSILLSAIFTLATPYFSMNFDAIFVIILRILTGMAQGVMSPAIYNLFSSWIPRSERSRSFSFFTIGGYVGSVITMPLSGYLCEYGNLFGLTQGWPTVFYVLGFLALFSVTIWWISVTDTPEKHSTISYEELKKIYSDLDVPRESVDCNGDQKNEKQLVKKTKIGSNVPWLVLLMSKDVWVVAISKFCVSWCNLLLMSKLPSYLDRILHMPIQKNAFINGTIYMFLCFSAFTFGWLSDLTIRKNLMSKLASRKLFESIALFGSGGFLMLIPFFGCHENIICILMILSSICYASISGGDNVIVCDLTTKYSGSLYGLTNAIGSIPGFLCPIFAGFLLNQEESIQNWNYIFIVSGCVSFFGGIIFLLFASVEPIKDLDNYEFINNKIKSNLESKLESKLPIKTIKSIADNLV